MEDKKESIVNEICKEQNFDEILLSLLNQSKDKRINSILENIRKNSKISTGEKEQLYAEIFEYVNEINEYCKSNIRMIFSMGVKATIDKLGDTYCDEKIKILIADDNVEICKHYKNYLERYEDIEILGIANNDKEEIKMIEELKPEIVITDLKRGKINSGLDIIKKYYSKRSLIKFLVISAEAKCKVIDNTFDVLGYITKPIQDFSIIYYELKRIHNESMNVVYEQHNYTYYYIGIVNLKKFFNIREKRILERLGIKLKNKDYSAYEIDILRQQLWDYTETIDEKIEVIEEIKKWKIDVEELGIKKSDFDNLIKKIYSINF